MSGSMPDFRQLAFVIVTFNPDIAQIARQLRSLPAESVKVLVDNASEPATADRLESMVQETTGASLFVNTTNEGLAAAVNRGVREVVRLSGCAGLVVLLDQDSEPQPRSIRALLDGYRRLQAKGVRVGCVGPTLVDSVTGLPHGFHHARAWRWRRVFAAPGAVEPIPCTTLNGSGTLVSIRLFEQLGGLDEGFFIDHVDTEWSFRVSAAGFSLWGIPDAVFTHSMGAGSARFWWFGWRVWPTRSPLRHYYLFRNAVSLIRRDYVPVVWKAWAVAKLLITALVHVVRGKGALEQLRQMGRGVAGGLRNQ